MQRGQRIGLIAAGLIIVAVAVVIAVSGGDDEKKTADTTTATAAVPAPAVEKQTLALIGGKPDGGLRTISARKGDVLALTVTSDQQVPIHLHGYDIEKEAGPGKPARYRVPLEIDGIFELEVESTGARIAKLKVQP